MAFAVAIRIVEVALHDAVTADQHLAVVGNPHLDVHAGQARGGGHVLERIAGARQRHVARFGEPVTGINVSKGSSP